jgi:hypothetical protein
VILVSGNATQSRALTDVLNSALYHRVYLPLFNNPSDRVFVELNNSQKFYFTGEGVEEFTYMYTAKDLWITNPVPSGRTPVPLTEFTVEIKDGTPASSSPLTSLIVN